jgi:3-dehydrosphinganine reductase
VLLLLADEKTKPELTKKLSTSSKLLDSMSVARSTLHGLKAGHFSISCNFDGLMLSVVGAGMSPQHSLPLAVLEVMTTGFFHIVAFFVLRGWYDTILSSTAQQQHKHKK